jgi:hypothetical protein
MALLSGVSVWFLLVYLAIVLPIDNVFPSINRWRWGTVFAALLLVITTKATAWMHSSRRRSLTNLTLFSLTSLICMLGIDIGSSAYFNLDDRSRDADGAVSTEMDEHVWYGELMPRPYYPTEANFRVYKPLQQRSGFSYGEHYYRALLDHPLLRDSVLTPAKIEFTIDRYGLRNTGPPEQAQIFTLGDSFCFGYDVTQSAVFSELLKQKLGQPVYNMGVHGLSPLQELLLLEHFIQTYPESFRPRQLLWLIFEGNDLEEDYASDRVQSGQTGLLGRAFRETLVEEAFHLPRLIRDQSLVRRITEGRVVLKTTTASSQKLDHYVLNGDRLAYPLYHSERFGYALYRPEYLERAGQPESYVLNHPNRPVLDETFTRMRDLSRKHGFEVTVVIVPTNIRLYKDSFEDLPPISEQPHFINYVRTLSDAVGFPRLDFNELMAPYAAQEFLYQRDDTHWNHRGHEVAAELLVRYAIK